MTEKNLSIRELAAISYALAVTRGQLHSVLIGEANLDEIRAVVHGTSRASLAKALKVSEGDVGLDDWNDYLTETEKRAIQGAINP